MPYFSSAAAATSSPSATASSQSAAADATRAASSQPAHTAIRNHSFGHVAASWHRGTLAEHAGLLVCVGNGDDGTLRVLRAKKAMHLGNATNTTDTEVEATINSKHSHVNSGCRV